MADHRLWTERQGGSLSLTRGGFHKLLELALAKCLTRGLFQEQLGIARTPDGRYTLSAGAHHPEEYFAFRLGDPWPVLVLKFPELIKSHTDDQIFDLVELLHREVASLPTDQDGRPSPGYDRNEGRDLLREILNPVLARREPPVEIDSTGTIVQRVEEPFRRLVEQPLPEEAPKREVVARVDDAVAHFRRRNATAGDRRAAVRELADVLEYLREDVKQHMLRKDEGDLFRIANEFALRHNRPSTRRDFDEPVWLAWMFYVYLATIRLILELRRRASDQ